MDSFKLMMLALLIPLGWSVTENTCSDEFGRRGAGQPVVLPVPCTANCPAATNAQMAACSPWAPSGRMQGNLINAADPSAS